MDTCNRNKYLSYFVWHLKINKTLSHPHAIHIVFAYRNVTCHMLNCRSINYKILISQYDKGERSHHNSEGFFIHKNDLWTPMKWQASMQIIKTLDLNEVRSKNFNMIIFLYWYSSVPRYESHWNKAVGEIFNKNIISLSTSALSHNIN